MKRQLFSLLNILLFTLCFTLANQLTFIFFEKHTKTSALWVDGPNVGHVRDWQYLDGSSMNTSNGLWEQKATINDEQCVRMFAFFDYLLTDQRCKQYMYVFICEMSQFNN